MIDFLNELDRRIPQYEGSPIQHRLLEQAKIIRERYTQHNSTQLYLQLRACLLNEKQLLSASSDISPMIMCEDQEQIALRRDIEHLLSMVTTNYETNKQITQEFETFSIQFHDCSKNNVLDINYTENPEKKKELNRLRNEQIERLYTILLGHILNLVEQFRDVLTATKLCLEKVISKYLAAWKTNQGLAGNGAKFYDNLGIIQEWFEKLSDIIWSTREQIRLLSKTKQSLTTYPPNLIDYLPQFLEQTTDLLTMLITNAFVIEKQPPQVMKTNTR